MPSHVAITCGHTWTCELPWNSRQNHRRGEAGKVGGWPQGGLAAARGVMTDKVFADEDVDVDWYLALGIREMGTLGKPLQQAEANADSKYDLGFNRVVRVVKFEGLGFRV